jgi:preprotein translocase subunit SecA
VRLRNIIDRLLERPVSRDRRPLESVVAAVNEREPALASVDLSQEAARLRAAIGTREPADAELVDWFALVREAARRELGLRAFDVQLMGALALHRGRVVEMDTGEGKTLVAVFAASLNALAGRGVHVLTVNDYLARRDAAWMRPVYAALGLRVECVQQTMGPSERRRAWGADVTYATANEAGWDYLRDHLAEEPSDVVHRPFSYAIVDEADSVLIDEGRLPLVIAGGESLPTDLVWRADEVVGALESGLHFATDEHRRNVHLTDAGLDEAERILGVADLYAAGNTAALTTVNLALHAHVLLRRDVDYIIRDGHVQLVDELKGRVIQRRRWPDGLHSAVEAKEGLDITREARILSRITFQALISLYPKVAGMTGTAVRCAQEMRELYGVEVTIIPPNVPRIREDLPDVVFATTQRKEREVVDQIVRAHAIRRPVLVGTSSVQESERIAASLRTAGVDCVVLNARNDELEAAIIARAGAPGAVTISTNMAGRGTDIRLGGPDESARDEVAALGGLLVIGTNRHESRRIDDQLRGRSGRQGDPGSSRFLVCLEDDLLRRYGGDELSEDGAADEGPVDERAASKEIERVQQLVEALHFQQRANLWRYSRIVEEQRRVIYGRRDDVLFGRADGMLRLREPDRFAELAAGVGEQAVEQAERRVTLFHLDALWEEHLADLADIREGIALMSVGRMNPVDEFHRRAIGLFDERFAQVDDLVVETLLRAPMTAGGIDLAGAGVVRPSATWTYLLGDNPAEGGTELFRFFRGLKKLILS